MAATVGRGDGSVHGRRGAVVGQLQVHAARGALRGLPPARRRPTGLPCWRDPWSASSAALRCCFRARPPVRPWWPGPPPWQEAQLPAPARCCPALRPVKELSASYSTRLDSCPDGELGTGLNTSTTAPLKKTGGILGERLRPYKARNSLLTLRVHPQVLLDVLLDGDPAIIDVDAWAENVDPLKHALVLLQDETDERHSFARLAGPKEDAVHGTRGTTGSEACLLVYSGVGKSLIFPIRPFALRKFRKPAAEVPWRPLLQRRRFCI